MALRGPKAWLWRRRGNPLKRRADKAEAWVVLGSWVLATSPSRSRRASASRHTRGRRAATDTP
ncbi:hypothetical protein GCM10027072_25100 [Streptomyces bullii]